MILRRLWTPLLATAVAAALSGCITLLPKTPPAQLYRFGASAADKAPVNPPAADKVGVLLEGISLPRAAAGDGILTTNGSQVAYVAGARWVTPAVILMTESVQQGFDIWGRRARLNTRGALGRSQASLKITVSDFQADYRNGATVAPVIVFSLRARLTKSDGQVMGERDFAVVKPAADNRVGPIVAGFDAAVAEVLGQVIGWTDATALAAAEAPPVIVPPASLPARRQPT